MTFIFLALTVEVHASSRMGRTVVLARSLATCGGAVARARKERGRIMLYVLKARGEYKAKKASHLKSHLAQVHNVGVTWHPCTETGCEYKAKTTSDLKTHLAHAHTRQESGVVWRRKRENLQSVRRGIDRACEGHRFTKDGFDARRARAALPPQDLMGVGTAHDEDPRRVRRW